MTDNPNTTPDQFTNLRNLAEETLQQRQAEDITPRVPGDIQSLVHELQIHQIELEMQNQELRKTQQRLVAARDRYVDLYDFAPIAYFTVGGEKSLILEANLTTTILLEMDRRDLLNKPLSNFITRNSQDAFYFHRKQVLETSTLQSCELKMVTVNGIEFYARLESITVQSKKSISGVQFRTAIIDITKSKQLEQALQKSKKAADAANQAKSQFLSVISHELRTPLFAITGGSEVLADRSFGELNPKQDRIVKDIASGSHRLLVLVNNVLDLTKIEAGQISLVWWQFDVAEALQESITAVETAATEKKITIALQVAPELPHLTTDWHRFQQILYNLLDNAIEFTPEGGQITVQATLISNQNFGDRPASDDEQEPILPDSLLLKISDTGIGIKPEDQQRIFDRFEQVDSSHSRTHGGTGLGLYVTKKLVDLHDGQIEVASEGQGSTFTVILPVNRKEAGAGEH